MKSEEMSARHGFGLKFLRQRFINRARYLQKDPVFLDDLRRAREFWNETYPRYCISMNDAGHDGPPQALLREGKPVTFPLDEAFLNSPMRVVVDEESEAELDMAIDGWVQLTTAIATAYWPQEDFPHPSVPEAHPAIPFVTKSLYLIHVGGSVSDVIGCFREFNLRPEPMTTRRGRALWNDVAGNEIEDVGWCLPLYPGITANDLEVAADDIAAEVERQYRHRTIEPRVVTLKRLGCKQKAIADQLGISESLVSEIREKRTKPASLRRRTSQLPHVVNSRTRKK